QVGDALEDVRALRRRAAAPVALEDVPRRRDGLVDLGGAAPRHLREQLAGRRIEVLEGDCAPRPLARDERLAPHRLADRRHRRAPMPIASSTSAKMLSKESATSAPASASARALSAALPRPRSITAAAWPKMVPGGN